VKVTVSDEVRQRLNDDSPLGKMRQLIAIRQAMQPRRRLGVGLGAARRRLVAIDKAARRAQDDARLREIREVSVSSVDLSEYLTRDGISPVERHAASTLTGGTL
jgi:hypothetical protein